MLRSPSADKAPQLIYINGMRTTQAGAEQHAQLLQSATDIPVYLVYDSRNTLLDGVRAKLGLIDTPTQRLIEAVGDSVSKRIPLIVVAQSLGSIKAQNAARAVIHQRSQQLHESGASWQDARINAMMDLSIVTWIFTGNTIWRIAPYLSGHLIYNIGDPLTRAFGSRQGTPRMQLITISHNPTQKWGDEHRFVHYLPTVAALIHAKIEEKRRAVAGQNDSNNGV